MTKTPQTMLEVVNRLMSLNVNSQVALRRCYDEWYLKQYIADKKRTYLVKAQTLRLEEHKDLGSDIAAARFVVNKSGGKVRTRDNVWITDNKQIPKNVDPNFALTYIDLSRSGIVTEGIDNLISLNHVESIDLSDNPQLDDFACDMLSRQFRNSKSLKEINMSFNPYISIYGLQVLFRIPSLKRLAASSTLASNHDQKEIFTVAADVEKDCEVIL